jgi:hypothetical protein
MLVAAMNPTDFLYWCPRLIRDSQYFSAPFALDFRIEEQKVMLSAHDKST